MVCVLGQRMDRYQKVEKPRAETPIDENEIRITSQGRMRSYITYAMTLLQVLFLSSPMIECLIFFFFFFFLPLFLCIVVVLDARARSMHVVEIVLCKRRIAENLELRLICNEIWMGKYRRGEKKFGIVVFFFPWQFL